jgi:hypothetical protein
MWLFRSQPAEEEEYEDGEYEDEDGSEYENENANDEQHPEEFEDDIAGEEGDVDDKDVDEASKYKKGGRPQPPIVVTAPTLLGKDVVRSAAERGTDTAADSSTPPPTATTANSNDESQSHLAESPSLQPTRHHGNGNRNGAAGKETGKGKNPTEEEEEDHDMDTVVVDDDMLDDGIPENVQVDDSHHSRNRFPSALSTSGIDYSDDEEDLATSFENVEEEEEEEEKEEAEEPEEEEEVTSMAEKQSLLVLAAEHDRVDILQAILSDGSQDRSVLLHATSSTSIPPLHIAVGYGSVGATNCLLRMGADPSLRPHVAAIQKEQKRQESPVEISNMARYDNVSAWELAFGCGDGVGVKAGWSLFGSPSSKVKAVPEDDDEDDDDPEGEGLSESIRSPHSTRSVRKPPRNVAPVTMAPSKREGIRHAFTAEALRCIGADEVDRLQQLVNSGMPMSIDIGGKNLYDWSVEMEATQCEVLLRPSEAERHGETTVVASDDNDGDGDQQTGGDSNTTVTTTSSNKKTAVLDRPGDEPAMHLVNRLDELESLSKALSICLDNLAEEVSVSHGLLLMGGGAAALASHVRGLKALKERKYDELVRMQEAWENSTDELAYWVKESGDQGKRIADLMTSSLAAAPPTGRKSLPEATSPEEERAQTQQLQAQIGASEYKIRKLRVAIADLSEENARNLKEVEKRGLSGGINLVRGLREEIRDTEFELSEAKSEEATCRTKISMIQSNLSASKKHPPPKTNKQDAITGTPEQPVDGKTLEATPAMEGGDQAGATESTGRVKNFSERIAAGESTAIVVRVPGNRGFFPVSLWQILLRIIGMGETPPSRMSESSIAHTTMII